MNHSQQLCQILLKTKLPSSAERKWLPSDKRTGQCINASVLAGNAFCFSSEVFEVVPEGR